MNKIKRLTNSYLLLIIGIAAVSTAAILIRFAMGEASPIVIAAYRMTFSAILAAILWLFAGSNQLIKVSKKNIALLFLSGTFLALHFGAWITSLEYISVSTSVILVTTTPLWVALLSPIFLKESVSRKFYFGMGIAILGGVIIGLNGMCSSIGGRIVCERITSFEDSTNFLGLFLALFGAWMAAGYMMIGRKLRAEISTVPYTAIVYGIAALLLILVVFFQRGTFFGYSPRIYLIFLGMAIIPQTLGHSILNYSLHSLPASVVSLALLGEPIGSTILAIIFLKEIPSMLEVIGGMLILFGVIIAVWQSRMTNEASPLTPVLD